VKLEVVNRQPAHGVLRHVDAEEGRHENRNIRLKNRDSTIFLP
jgi:hypothetical protein